MIEMIKSINIQFTGYIAVSLLLLVILCHGLIISKIIPYTWVNGGRSKSYEEQRKQSIGGIVALLLMIPFFLQAGNIININIGSSIETIMSVILWILTILLTVSYVMQLFGTKFEKYVMSTVVLILLLCVFRMALN